MVTKELWLSHQSLPLCVVRVAGAQLLETQWFLTSGLNILYAQNLLPALPWLLFPSRAFSLVTCLRGSNTGQRQEGDRWGVKWKPGESALRETQGLWTGLSMGSAVGPQHGCGLVSTDCGSTAITVYEKWTQADLCWKHKKGLDLSASLDWVLIW